MLISIVIPTHNRPELLAEALLSIAGQSARNYEVVIVDDGSKPPVSKTELEEHTGVSFNLVRHEAARGVPAAKNAGLAAARGEIVLLLDDDDLLAVDAVQRITSAFADHPALDCVFMGVEPFGPYAEGAARGRASAMRALFELAEPRRDGDLFLFGERLFEALLKTVPIDFQRPAARRGLWNVVGAFDEACLFSESAWSIRAATLGRIALLDAPINRWRIHGGNFGWPAEMDADHARRRQIDNGVAASRHLRAVFERDAAAARGRAEAVRRHHADGLFSSAYFLRDKDRRAGWRALTESFRCRPSARHLKLAISYLLPTRRRA
ncbi:MAG: glycosyltransferase family 2 protein [Rubrivivax sp.]